MDNTPNCCDCHYFLKTSDDPMTGTADECLRRTYDKKNPVSGKIHHEDILSAITEREPFPKIVDVLLKLIGRERCGPKGQFFLQARRKE